MGLEGAGAAGQLGEVSAAAAGALGQAGAGPLDGAGWLGGRLAWCTCARTASQPSTEPTPSLPALSPLPCLPSPSSPGLLLRSCLHGTGARRPAAPSVPLPPSRSCCCRRPRLRPQCASPPVAPPPAPAGFVRVAGLTDPRPAHLPPLAGMHHRLQAGTRAGVRAVPHRAPSLPRRSLSPSTHPCCHRRRRAGWCTSCTTPCCRWSRCWGRWAGYGPGKCVWRAAVGTPMRAASVRGGLDRQTRRRCCHLWCCLLGASCRPARAGSCPAAARPCCAAPAQREHCTLGGTNCCEASSTPQPPPASNFSLPLPPACAVGKLHGGGDLGRRFGQDAGACGAAGFGEAAPAAADMHAATGLLPAFLPAAHLCRGWWPAGRAAAWAAASSASAAAVPGGCCSARDRRLPAPPPVRSAPSRGPTRRRCAQPSRPAMPRCARPSTETRSCGCAGLGGGLHPVGAGGRLGHTAGAGARWGPPGGALPAFAAAAALRPAATPCSSRRAAAGGQQQAADRAAALPQPHHSRWGPHPSAAPTTHPPRAPHALRCAQAPLVCRAAVASLADLSYPFFRTMFEACDIPFG